MKPSWIQRTLSSRYLWSILGGLALASSFPKLGFAGFAWIAPGCILFAAVGRTGGKAFRIGYAGGFAYALGAFYWILFIPFPAGAISGWFALSAYLALYMGFWVWFCWRTFHGRRGSGGNASRGAPDAIETDAFREFFSVPLPKRILWALACATVWVALEMLLARLFTGFPWNLLGVSQHRILPVIQIASFTGVYGVSFLVAWFSVSLAMGALRLGLNPAQSKAWVGDLIVPFVALLGVAAWGSGQLSHRHPPARTLKTVLVQPSIPQTLIWDTNQNAIRFTELLELSERALQQTTNAQLLVWPESAMPKMLRFELSTYRAVTNLVMKHDVWMILGSDDAAPRPGTGEREFDYFNSSFLITPKGDVNAPYKKRRLVIFGEYIPLERWVPFTRYLTPIGGGFTAGEEALPFRIPELDATVSVLICFEDIFPHMGAGYVEEDTDFLLNLTNNGWFGETAAQWQHAANAVFRAVENRIPLVRCTNNGLTCWVDAHGGMHDVYFPGTDDVYRAGFKAVDVPLLAPGETRQLTFYTRRGDLFGWTCVAAAVALLLRAAIAGRGRVKASS